MDWRLTIRSYRYRIPKATAENKRVGTYGDVKITGRYYKGATAERHNPTLDQLSPCSEKIVAMAIIYGRVY